jgi:tight adherence protein C
MGIVIFSFIAVFLLIASGGLLLFYRHAMLERISSVVTARSVLTDVTNISQKKSAWFGGMVQKLEGIVPKSQAEVSVVRQRLIRAGYRSDSAIKVFYGAKVLSPIVLCTLITASGFANFSPFTAYVAALGIGFLVPDFWLGRRITLRQKQIRLGLPEVLDFLIICIEAGLSMDQATARTAQELRMSQPALSDELDIVVLEQRAGRARSDAWKEFAERTGVDNVRRLVSVLVQSEQLGTSVAKTLRIHSDTLRTQRRQEVEEKAAKTTIKLVFPLVFFIFPSLFLVTLGPAAILITEGFAKLFTH